MGAGRVTSAKIRFQVPNICGAPSDSGGRIHSVSCATWTETTATWNTRPAFDPAVLSSVGTVVVDQLVDFNVTSAIPGDGTYCFAIDSLSTNGVDYNSREGALAHPTVLLTTVP